MIVDDFLNLRNVFTDFFVFGKIVESVFQISVFDWLI